ncbi:MAG: hypothetical protein DDT37_01091 [Firmicutes bacterium]|nr:hypothetical protein [candidate division NPL-UPA2 bacterium]MBT9156107.1 hypothetical protein [candidate division NPL-UPA2 bacterium]
MNRPLVADVLVAEIGSTTTVVNAFAGFAKGEPRFLGQGVAPTSVLEGDVTVGLEQAVRDLKCVLGTDLTWKRMLATSSAAGGLRMTVHGLAYDMTARAAREAALGAGAIVKLVTSGELTAQNLREIVDTAPNIILLAGGVDYGESATAIANAKKIAALPLLAPVIYAGNIACQGEVAEIIKASDKHLFMVDNVYPRIDELCIEPTRAVIQQVFEEHIVHAPGMERIREMVQGSILPTPGAVMKAAEALHEQLGDLLVVDVGGATTDVHSVTQGSEELARLLLSPEPKAKRTVEGDLGVYVNVRHIADLVKPHEAEKEGLDLPRILDGWPPLPVTTEQYRALTLFTRKAVETALERHVGRIKHLYGPFGRTTIAVGKDLTEVRWVVGTGGPLTRLTNAAAILKSALRVTARQEMYPKNFQVLIDSDYNLGVLGVLSQEYKREALLLMQRSLGVEV